MSAGRSMLRRYLSSVLGTGTEVPLMECSSCTISRRSLLEGRQPSRCVHSKCASRESSSSTENSRILRLGTLVPFSPTILTSAACTAAGAHTRVSSSTTQRRAASV